MVYVFTPAFSVMRIGDILVHLSTCYVTWPKSKCYHNGLFYDRTRLFAIKYGFICHQIKVGVSRSHFVRDKSTVLNVYIVQILTRYRPNSTGSHHWAADRLHTNRLIILWIWKHPIVTNFFSHVRSVRIIYLSVLPLIIWKIACFRAKHPLQSMSKDGMSKDEPRCRLCLGWGGGYF